MHCVDWLPTIAELTGYQPSVDLKWDGVSQWPALTGDTPTAPRNIYIAMPGASSLRSGDWKLISRKQGPPELFQIATDPYEKENVATKVPDKVAELTRLLNEERAKDNPVLPEDLKGLPH